MNPSFLKDFEQFVLKLLWYLSPFLSICLTFHLLPSGFFSESSTLLMKWFTLITAWEISKEGCDKNGAYGLILQHLTSCRVVYTCAKWVQNATNLIFTFMLVAFYSHFAVTCTCTVCKGSGQWIIWLIVFPIPVLGRGSAAKANYDY